MSNSQTMKAARFHRKGPPDVLVYEDVPKPQAGPGQVLIRVEAAGVNFAEIERRRGGFYPVPTPLPYILGGEYAGVVETLGAGVENIAVGTKVFGMTGALQSECYAQYVAAPAELVIPLPDGIGGPEATALLVQGMTAYFLLRESVRLQKNESVMIQAAAGGVGSIAVQLAKIFGAGRIIGTASSPEKRKLVCELGADVAVDYTKEGWADEVRAATGGRGVDGALLMIGGDSLLQALGALAPIGRARVYGHANNEMVVVDFAALMGKGRMAMNQTLGFFNLGGYVTTLAGSSQKQAADAFRNAIGEMVQYVRAGRLRLSAKHQLPLSRASEAHRLVETRQTTGKVVLLPWA